MLSHLCSRRARIRDRETAEARAVRLIPTSIVVVGASACVDTSRVVVGSACDADAPTTIVQLESDEVVQRIWSIDGSTAMFRSGPTDSESGVANTRLLAASTCGDDPRELATGLEVLAVDDVVLACDPSNGALVRLHVKERAPATVLAEGVACAVARFDEGLVTVGRDASGFGPLSWIGLDGSTRVLHPSVRVPSGASLAAEPLAADDGHVLALTATHEIVDVDFDGASVVLREDVADFRASSDLRFVVWQREPADGPAGESEILVWDRERDVETVAFVATLSWSWAPFSTGYLVLRHEAWGDDRVFTLPDVGAVDLPAELSVRGVTDIGHVVYAFGPGDWHDVDLWRWDPRDDSHLQLVDGAAMIGFADDGLETFLPAADAGLQRGDVELRAWDDGRATVLARDVPSSYARRDDGWIAAVHDDDGDRRGMLRLHRGEASIDVVDGAWIYDAGLDKGRVFGDDVVYDGEDADGPALRRVSVPR
jgi:hypothetical protein